MKYNEIEKFKHSELEELTYAQLEADDGGSSIKKENIIVFEPFENDFDHKGVAVLNGVISSLITHELNGNYSISLEIPKDERGKYKRILPLSILKARGQLFRIPLWNGVKDNGFKLKIYAEHISYDARSIFTEDRRVNEQPIYEALNRLLESDLNNRFKIGPTDITTTANANFIMEDFIDSLFKKIIPRWGGELLRDNFEFTVKRTIGEYKPDLYVRYGKNSTSFDVKLDYTNLCTKIYPVGKEGITIAEIENGRNYLYSKNFRNYPIEYPKKVKFDDIETPEELKVAALEYLDKYSIPVKTISVDLISLELNEAYDNLKSAIKMNLGDVVTAYDEDFNIADELKVVSMDIDGETGEKKKIILGELASTLADVVTDVEEKQSEIQDRIESSITTSDDIKKLVAEHETEIEELKKVDENLNKDITSVNLEVGQLAALETEHKKDLVGAINEVKGLAAAADDKALIGDLKLLETEVKTDIVSAINELYDSINSSETPGGSNIEVITRLGELEQQVINLETEQKKIMNILIENGLYTTT